MTLVLKDIEAADLPRAIKIQHDTGERKFGVDHITSTFPAAYSAEEAMELQAELEAKHADGPRVSQE